MEILLEKKKKKKKKKESNKNDFLKLWLKYLNDLNIKIIK